MIPIKITKKEPGANVMETLCVGFIRSTVVLISNLFICWETELSLLESNVRGNIYINV